MTNFESMAELIAKTETLEALRHNEGNIMTNFELMAELIAKTETLEALRHVEKCLDAMAASPVFSDAEIMRLDHRIAKKYNELG